MLAPGNYVQWKSIIKRYIDTKPNHELIHYCLTNPPYELEICDQLNAEAKEVQIILTGIDNDIYSTVDACPNACEMWKAIERLKQGESINDKEIGKLMALISLSFKKIYKPTNNNLKTSSNISRANQDNSPRINRSVRYENQRIGNVAGARETVDQELEAHYMYMAQLQEVSLDAPDSGPIFDDEPLQKDCSYLGLRKKNRLSLKNDMPPRNKPGLRGTMLHLGPNITLSASSLGVPDVLPFLALHREAQVGAHHGTSHGIPLIGCPSRSAKEMLRLRDLGANTPSGVPYTEEQILALVRKGKQRGHIPGETYKNVSQEICDQLNAEAKVVQIILTGIDNDIYSTVDACLNACEMWKAIKRLKQGESINVQDLKTNLYWEIGKFTSQDGESLESYYSRFYKMRNELIRNQCKVTNHQVNVQFLLQLQPEWQRFVTLVKQNQKLKTVSFHKLYDILKQHQHEVNEIRAEKIARVANPLALVAQQQPIYHPQTHPTHYTQNSSTRSQQAATRNRGKAIVNSSQPIYDQEPSMVAEDDEMSQDKEIDKLMALISLSFKKIYKPTNNNLRTSSNISRANQDNSLRINRSVRYENQRIGNVAGARETVGSTTVQKSRIQCYNCKEFRHVARECQKPKTAKDAAYHREKMLLCKQEEAGIQLNVDQADWRDDTNDDELEDQELEAHYMYMAQLQEVSPNAPDSGPIFDDEPLQKVSNDEHYNVFAMESEHPEQSKSVHDTYPIDQDAHNVIIDSLDMSYDREEIDQNDDDNDLELLASLIEKLKCEIDENKNRNKFLETSNKVLIEKLKVTEFEWKRETCLVNLALSVPVVS
uniref:CCHC-type domain-containing protein n=1 Tax=Tanacetum cinerariifolium TaxID=118510 RepID=A0A6L2K1E0_TANCI|nr:hypothetical protein [Tanacetum cinerariifolium]